MPLDPLRCCCRVVQRIKAASFCIVLFFFFFFSPSFIFHPVSHSERTALSSIVSKSRTSQSIRVCSSHFLLSLLVFFFCFWDPGDIFKVPDPCLETLCMCPHLSTPKHTNTQRERADIHIPRLEPAPVCSSTSEKLELGIEKIL